MALLDTTVLVGVETGRLDVADLPDQGSISAVTLEELYLGVLHSSGDVLAQRSHTYELASSAFPVISVDAAVARACAQIRAAGRARGRRYQLGDSLIGATARVHGLPLLTQDSRMVGMLGVDVRVV